jgi:hypothetical protein
MEASKSSLSAFIRVIFGDTWRVIRAMPGVALTVLLIVLAQDVLNMLLRALPPSPHLLLGGLVKLAVLFMLIHYFIVVHRFLVLGEVAPRFRFEPLDCLTWRFFGAWVVLSLVSALPFLLATGLIAARGVHWILVASAVAVGVANLVLALRMTILLPAIAVGAPGATWTNAYHDTKGHAASIFVVFLVASVLFAIVTFLASLPAMLVGIAGAALIGSSRGFAAVTTVLLLDVMSVVGMTYFIAIASRLFQRFGDRVKQFPGQPFTV